MNELLQKLPLIFVSEQLTNYTDIDLTYLFVYKYYIFIGLFLVNQFEFLIRKFQLDFKSRNLNVILMIIVYEVSHSN